jgi:hypothetical protein
MPKYRDQLPQLDDGFFLTDGGLETTLIFHDKLDLPYFAAFHLLKDEAGTEALRQYYRTYASIACANGLGVKGLAILRRHFPKSTASPSHLWESCASNSRPRTRQW